MTEKKPPEEKSEALAKPELPQAEPNLELPSTETADSPEVLETSELVQTLLHRRVELRVAPLPPPEELKAYGEQNPEWAERIFANYDEDQCDLRRLRREEQEKRHAHNDRRLTIADRELRGDRWTGRLGVVCAFLVGLAAIGAATYLGKHGEWKSVASLAGLGLAAVISALIRESRARRGSGARELTRPDSESEEFAVERSEEPRDQSQQSPT